MDIHAALKASRYEAIRFPPFRYAVAHAFNLLPATVVRTRDGQPDGTYRLTEHGSVGTLGTDEFVVHRLAGDTLVRHANDITNLSQRVFLTEWKGEVPSMPTVTLPAAASQVLGKIEHEFGKNNIEMLGGLSGSVYGCLVASFMILHRPTQTLMSIGVILGRMEEHDQFEFRFEQPYVEDSFEGPRSGKMMLGNGSAVAQVTEEYHFFPEEKTLTISGNVQSERTEIIPSYAYEETITPGGVVEVKSKVI